MPTVFLGIAILHTYIRYIATYISTMSTSSELNSIAINFSVYNPNTISVKSVSINNVNNNFMV